MAIQTALDSISNSSGSPFGFKNRIINGAMVIDQRNAGASISATGYPVDRFSVVEQTSATFTAQQSTTAPAGFVNSLLITIGTGAAATSTQYAVTGQSIEGLNCTDLGFGSASAQAVTLSFWVRSSLTGVYCASIRNSGGTRAYIKEYTISSANTWEYKTLTFPGDVSGTWLTTNGIGITVYFDLGSGSGTPTGAADSWITTNSTRTTNQTNFVGTSGATFYITGVQLERGSNATSFEFRSYGQELALCQRYAIVYGREQAYNEIGGSGWAYSTTTVNIPVAFPVQMRSTPTVSTSGNFAISDGASGFAASNINVISQQSSSFIASVAATGSGLTSFRPYRLETNNTTAAYAIFSAEL